MNDHDQELLNYVTRHEFEKLTETVQDVTTTVSSLSTSVKAQTENIGRLTTVVSSLGNKVAEQGTPKGMQVSTVLTALGVLSGWSVILGALVAMHVAGQVAPIAASLVDMKSRIETHVERGAHPEAQAKLAVLSQQISANHIENETQHKWIRDVLNLQDDWTGRIQRLKTREDGSVVVPPPSYQPLQDAGEGFK